MNPLAIAAVEAQLGEPLRDDGPILGVSRSCVANDLILSFRMKFKFKIFILTVIILGYPLQPSKFVVIFQSSELGSKQLFILEQMITLQYPITLY